MSTQDNSAVGTAEQGWLDHLLGGAAMMPLMVLVILIVTLLGLTPARAEDLACGGHDLLADLKAKDPKAFADFMAEGDKIENGESIFWKIEKPGLKPSWLLGTFHVTDPRVTAMPEPARKPFEQSATLIVESDEIVDQQAASMKLMAQPGLMMFPGKETLRDHLKPEEIKLLEGGMIKRGIPLGSVIKMRPWLVTSMLALSSCELSRKAKGMPFLDMKLALDAQAKGKKLVGLETLAEQLEAIAGLPTDFHVRSLVSVIRYPDFATDMMETTTQLYLSGHASLIIPASLRFNPDPSNTDAADLARFEQKLVIDRNHTMAKRAAPVLADGNVFMAVGAAHLYGKQGVVALLKQQGYTLTPVR